MHKEIEGRALRAIEEKAFPGCVVGTVKANGERDVWSFGTLIYESGEKVREDTIYDLASITKSIPTASLALSFIEGGRLKLEDPVLKYIPELHNDFGATIEDLLCYRVRGTRLSTLRYKTFEEIRTHVFEHGFDGPPGERHYTNLPAYILGVIVERIGNASLAKQAHDRFFEPLHMSRTTFFPSTSDCAPTEIDERGVVQGLPHDESAYVFAKERRAVGHAGLFSTVPDLLNFLESLLKGEYSYVADGAQKGLGWQLRDQMEMGKRASPQAFGKTGFTGTSIVVDMGAGLGFVILSNRTYPTRPKDMSAINEFRADIADIIIS
ncbi:hypothetical protein COU18_00785 [Candidatus Kaiserbacteria bacterium CG10_big_fil_rev_8_21_14_0_10_51_14]|uniref:Beta-lactamase-related domain-containing protein n=1 Tax=Candidatus Kaiserbacteria bacterium CG10_big_fil_rev_8_21_14_0_10_51_14 TaxID=1974610 RepID=A0A2H0UBX8_9BACT|nr:MAG: hypothetical protein COU18_00785 [Candidatus Kaiserbacteria bacterium CG10_big_fil_rev_8_21_14_0_10_51_14]